jgi:hypothetical protein
VSGVLYFVTADLQAVETYSNPDVARVAFETFEAGCAVALYRWDPSAAGGGKLDKFTPPYGWFGVERSTVPIKVLDKCAPFGTARPVPPLTRGALK